MTKALAYTIFVILFGIIVVLFLGRFLNKMNLKKEFEGMSSELNPELIIKPDSYSNLPQNVKNYLKFSGINSVTEPPHNFRMRMSGVSKRRLNSADFQSFSEVYGNLSPFFLKFSEVKPIPIFEYTSSELYRNNIGFFKEKMLSVVNLREHRGKQINISHLIKLLSYMPFFPTMALDKGLVKWKSIDDSKSKAIIFNGKNIALGIFSFLPSGQISSFETKEISMEDENKHVVKVNMVVEYENYSKLESFNVPHSMKIIVKRRSGNIVLANYTMEEIDWTNFELF